MEVDRQCGADLDWRSLIHGFIAESGVFAASAATGTRKL